MSSRRDAAFGAVRTAMASVPKPSRNMFRRGGDAPAGEDAKSARSAHSDDRTKHPTRTRGGDKNRYSPRRRRDEGKDSDNDDGYISDDGNGGEARARTKSPAGTGGGGTLRRRNVPRAGRNHRGNGGSPDAATREEKAGDWDDEERGGPRRSPPPSGGASPAAPGGRAKAEAASSSAGRAAGGGSSSAARPSSLRRGMRGEPEGGGTPARLRTPAEGIPEVHFLGEIVGGTNLVLPGGGDSGAEETCYSCRWSIEYGKSWSLLAGECAGQSQYCLMSHGGRAGGAAARREWDAGGECVWDHPLDVHFATASLTGWPRIMLQLWTLDEYGRANLAGYGFVHFPTAPGQHELTVQCWRPKGSLRDEIQSFFLGSTPHLTDEDSVFGKAWQDRHRLVTVPTGEVHIHLSVVQRSFAFQAIDGT